MRLPIEGCIPELRAVLSDETAAVLVAQPGAGKTTVVPLRLLEEPWLGDGRILMLEPRRVATRAAAARMAALHGDPLGMTIGYTTRDDRRVSPATRVEVVTDGILTRRLQADPELNGVGLVIFDEFHERHLQSDLGLALTLDARDGLRPDLRLLVMSATLDAEQVATTLGDAPVIRSLGQQHPVEIRWRPAKPARLTADMASVVRHALAGDPGDVLVFLPGVGEIAGLTGALAGISGVDLVPLHGSLPAHQQDRGLRPGPGRRVILATDLAESSVTVDGVRVVVDSGLARRPAHDPGTGLTRLRTIAVSQASADQRAGRAGRQHPGVAYRMWSEQEHRTRRAWSDPEIALADLTSLALELAAWGASADALRWVTPPPPGAMASAVDLLEELGAVSDHRPTELGRRLAALPLHPRLARMLVGAPSGEVSTAALLAALLSERDVFRHGNALRSVDVADRLAALDGRLSSPLIDKAAVAVVKRRADELVRRVRVSRAGSSKARSTGADAEQGRPGAEAHLLAEAYPDRIAQRRGEGRYRLRHGGGAALPAHDPLATAAWLVVADLEGPGGPAGRADGSIRLAAALDIHDVERIGGDAIRDHESLVWDERVDDLRLVTTRSLGALELGSTRTPARPGPETAAALAAHARDNRLRDLGWTPGGRSLQARAMWAHRTLGPEWPDVSDDALSDSTEAWLVPLLARARSRIDLARIDPVGAIRGILGRQAFELDRLLPSTLEVRPGRRVPIDYSGERPRAAVRVHDLYGSRAHPAVLGGQIPITLEILSPAGRPIQITADLPGFWAGSWKQVRREMASRYPKHRWPEDPAVFRTDGDR